MAAMVLESSVEEFVARFRAHAAHGTIYPQGEGSPLLEFAAAGRVLYLFDRSGPYAARPGEGQLIVHGVADMIELTDAREETWRALGVSEVEGVGEVLEVGRGLGVVRARLPIVLGRFGGWPPVQVGDWVRFKTLPPLHGFALPS